MHEVLSSPNFITFIFKMHIIVYLFQFVEKKCNKAVSEACFSERSDRLDIEILVDVCICM